MRMSRLPRSDWLGSSTSPPLTTRSNLSSGAMAARAEPPRASANEPAVTRKSRRDALGMAFLLLRFGLALDPDHSPDQGRACAGDPIPEFVVMDPRNGVPATRASRG